MAEYAGAIIGGLGFLLTAAGALMTMVWRLAAIKETLRQELEDRITSLKGSADSKIDTMRREFGETVAAARQKIHEVELHAAQTYVSHDGLHQLQTDLTSDFKELREWIDKRFTRIEERIEARPN